MHHSILELRIYALRSGQREVLIDLFEREFVESQETLGARIVGTFRDLDVEDRFVWMRSFPDMDVRRRALTDFYSGPVWRAHRDAANATMVDSDDVYLLRGVGPSLSLPSTRPAIGSRTESPAMFVVDIHPADQEAAWTYADRARRDHRVIATFETERSPNDFPALPVREENVLAILRRFEAVGDFLPLDDMPPAARTLRLAPTARSLLH